MDKDAREAALAKALRANLRRRKAAAAPSAEPSKPTEEEGPSCAPSDTL
jgi:hypothetical protein